jgi:hypothetical protein
MIVSFQFRDANVGVADDSFGQVDVRRKNHSTAAKEEQYDDVLNSRGKRSGTFPIQRVSQHREDGAPCHHYLGDC